MSECTVIPGTRRENGPIRKALLIGAAATGVVFATAAGTFAVAQKEAVAAVLSEPEADEEYILSALEASGITKDRTLWLNCEADESRFVNADNQRLEGYANGSKLTGILPVIHVKQSLCDSVVDYSRHPDKSAVTPEKADALRVVIHEAEHVITGSYDEALVECLSFQKIPAFAEELGATPTQAMQAQEAYIGEYHKKAEEYRTSDCYDGGPYDIDPQTAGIFPYPLA